MLLKRLSLSLGIAIFIVVPSLATLAEAEEKKLLVAFDRNVVCCILNSYQIEEKLEEVDGINKVNYNEPKREITIIFETEKIGIPGIVEAVQTLTDVEDDVLLPPKKL